VLISLSFHEAAHGYVANLLGDDTAKKLGRVTLNPLKHIDRFGTVILPMLLIIIKSPFIFGWAKPIPVKFHRLKNPLRDMVFVAIAGPVTNIILAVVAALILSMMYNFGLLNNSWLVHTCTNFFLINIILAVFNMIPIPPLDGGRVAVGLLPTYFSYQLAKLERYGFFIIITGLFILPLIGQKIDVPLEPIHWFIQSVSNFLINIIAIITGLQI
jgi:Zn-dependent protease